MSAPREHFVDVGGHSCRVWEKGDGPLDGSADALVPASYAERSRDGIAGTVELKSIEGAGHLADIDAPDAVADAVLAFLGP